MTQQVTLGDIIGALTPYQPDGMEPPLSAVVVDSREAIPESLFVALKGERVDGHDFVQSAFDRGSIAALVEREVAPAGETVIDLRQAEVTPETLSPSMLPVLLIVHDSLAAMQTAAKAWRDRFDIKVIGVTGSVGKSSTKELAHAVLSQRYLTFKSPGNRNSILGLPPALFDLGPQHQRAVLEMGMYSTGEISRMCALTSPTVGVLTIIGPVHLERAGSMEAIVAAKRELVESLPSNGVAILNRDDERVMSMAAHTDADIFTYGLDSRADLWADNIHSMGLDGVHFDLHYRRETVSISMPMLGRHSVHTAMRAAAVGLSDDLSWEEIVRGLRTSSTAQFRLVAVPGPNDSTIIDDTYNSSPDSALAALNLLQDLNGRHVAVLGDMLELGHMEAESHRLIGRRAADVAQLLIAVGTRSKLIAGEAARVGMSPNNIYWVADAQEAIPILEANIDRQDTVLVKGSYGMRMDRIVAALGSEED